MPFLSRFTPILQALLFLLLISPSPASALSFEPSGLILISGIVVNGLVYVLLLVFIALRESSSPEADDVERALLQRAHVASACLVGGMGVFALLFIIADQISGGQGRLEGIPALVMMVGYLIPTSAAALAWWLGPARSRLMAEMGHAGWHLPWPIAALIVLMVSNFGLRQGLVGGALFLLCAPLLAVLSKSLIVLESRGDEEDEESDTKDLPSGRAGDGPPA